MINKPDKVILHCAATPDYADHHSKFDSIGIEEIRKWHRQRGFRDVGYHFVVRRTGIIELGRPLDEIGAHVKGHNTGSVGICYIGTKNPTERQIRSIALIAKMLKQSHGIGPDAWHGHNDFTTKKTCPGFTINLIREIIRLELSKMESTS